MPSKLVTRDLYTPDWVKPENAREDDPYWLKVARQVAGLLGATDPASTVMGLGGALEGPATRKMTSLADFAAGKAKRAVTQEAATVARLQAQQEAELGGRSVRQILTNPGLIATDPYRATAETFSSTALARERWRIAQKSTGLAKDEIAKRLAILDDVARARGWLP